MKTLIPVHARAVLLAIAAICLLSLTLFAVGSGAAATTSRYLHVSEAQLQTKLVARGLHLRVQPQFGDCRRLNRIHVNCQVTYRHMPTESPTVHERCDFVSSVIKRTNGSIHTAIGGELCREDDGV